MLDGNKEELLEDTLEELIDETGQWTKQEALYVEVPEITSECSICSFYNNGAGTCELVEGSISPEGHCRFWVDKEEVMEEPQALSQSIEDLEADEDFLYMLALMQDDKLPNYKFETLLDSLAADLFEEKQELSVSLTKKDKSEAGGLTAAGRAKFNRKGANLKPPVNKSPTTPEQIRRQGQFLTRMYGRDKIPPLKKPDGKPTRYALQANIWNSPIPKTIADVRRLAAKGEALLKRYASLKEKSKKSKEKLSQSDKQEVPITELPICLSNGMVKIPIAKKGSWFHDTHGVVSFTDEDFAQIKKESSKEVLGFTPYITYGHPTDLPYESVDAQLKKGDLQGWEENEDTLFGLFDAKEDVLQLVNNKDYEYSSGEFLRNYKDKFTGVNKGTVLMRVALTNSPFIPFGDTKVEALSTNANTDEQGCLPSPISYVIKLSTDIDENIKPDLEIKDNPEPVNMQVEKTPEQLAEELLAKTPTDTVEQPVVEPKKAVVEEVKAEAPVSTPAPQQTSFTLADITKLIESVTNKADESFKSTLEAIKTEHKSVVDSLTQKIEGLTTQLSTQQEVTQAFSTSLSNQAKNQQYRELAANGVPAVLIQKFSQIENALETKQSVIKLSSTAADGQVSEYELPVLKAVKELLLDAVSTEPLLLSQQGQTAKPGNVGFAADLQNLAARNRELASKKAK